MRLAHVACVLVTTTPDMPLLMFWMTLEPKWLGYRWPGNAFDACPAFREGLATKSGRPRFATIESPASCHALLGF